MEWLVVGGILLIVIAVLVPGMMRASRRRRVEGELRDVIANLKRFKCGERLGLVTARAYLDASDMKRCEHLLEVLTTTYEQIRAGKINARKVERIDNECTILESKLTVAAADALVERLEAVVTDPDATRRHLRRAPRN